jgi:hypothetical protein
MRLRLHDHRLAAHSAIGHQHSAFGQAGHQIHRRCIADPIERQRNRRVSRFHRDAFRKVRSVHQNNVAAERLHFRDNLVTSDDIDRSQSKRFRDRDCCPSDAGIGAILDDPRSARQFYDVGQEEVGSRQGASVLMRSAQAGCRKGASVRSPPFKCFTPAPTATTRPAPSVPMMAGSRGR